MKITVNETDNTKKYPYVGRCGNGAVVLFTDVRSGVCLIRGKHSIYPVGEYDTDWTEHNFKLMHGTITIECP